MAEFSFMHDKIEKSHQQTTKRKGIKKPFLFLFWSCLSASILILVFIFAGHWLIIDQKLSPADVIVVLSGSDQTRLAKAAELYTEGYADNIILTNTGQYYSKYNLSENQIQFEKLKKLGIPEGALYIAKFQAKNTGQEATGIIEQMYEMSAQTAIIVTDAWHTRRVKIIFSDSFGNTGYQIQYASAGNTVKSRNFWWLSRSGWIQVPGEYLRIIGYYIKRDTNIPDYPKFNF